MTARPNLGWRNALIMILGVWVALSPWLLAYGDTHEWAAYSAVAAGVALIVVEAIAIETAGAWERWATLAIGLWLIVATLAFGLATHPGGLAGKLAVGVLIASLASWTLCATRSSLRGSRGR